MDHQDVLEQLELAAVEPGGLERLVAGDTPTAAAVAGHLAGCPACTAELDRLTRTAPLLRDVIRTTPAPDLRDRTLAYVRAHGIARGAEAVDTGAPAGAATPTPPSAPATPTPIAASHRGRRDTLLWLGGIAAAVLISVAASTLIIGGRVDDQLAAQDRTIAGLEAVTNATIAITADPESERIGLASTGAGDASGTLLYSPSTAELVVVASGLEDPGDGQEYRCWILIDGERQDVGRMNFADDLAYWVGVTPSVSSVPDGTMFGVSLAELDGSGAPSDPVIAGEL